jgi:cell division protein FtsZ
MEDSGSALMGIGRGAGDSRAQVAAQNAISSPLLEESSIAGATGIIVNLTGPSHMAMQELNDAMAVITEESDTDNIIFGLTYDDSLSDDEIHITVIATGFEYGSSHNQDTYADTRDTGEFLGRFGQNNRFSDRSRRSPRDSYRPTLDSSRNSRFNRRSFDKDKDKDKDQANQKRSDDNREFAAAPASETLDLPEMMRTQEPSRTAHEQASQNRPSDVGADIEIPTWLRINKDD